MKKTLIRTVALFFAMLIPFACVSVAYAAEGLQEETPIAEEAKPEIAVISPSMDVVVGKTLQLEAKLTNCPEKTRVHWSTSDAKVAVVDDKGLVKAKKVGRAVITAKADVDGKEISGGYAVMVTTRKGLIKELLKSRQILSYQYSYTDDYYYTNDKDCWQSKFGYSKFYDIVAPYIMMEYDYVRVHFTYEGKDWMIQLWKGQYGMLFYGSEIGVYTKAHSDSEDKLFTFYGCASQPDWLKMESTLYHQRVPGGNYVREFTRDYDTYWWCTGFKSGHLLVQEPAKELRMESRITFKTEEMAQLFAEGMKECEFTEIYCEDPENTKLDIDEFFVDGKDVYLKWQNISGAENTMPIKMAAGTLAFLNVIAVLLAFFALIGAVGMFIVI